jgi:hypothetical protein
VPKAMIGIGLKDEEQAYAEAAISVAPVK